jgi:hypothetical protein
MRFNPWLIAQGPQAEDRDSWEFSSRQSQFFKNKVRMEAWQKHEYKEERG